MKSALACLALVLAGCAPTRLPRPSPPRGARRCAGTRIAEAKTLAAADKKPLHRRLLRAQGCNRCELMDRKVYGDPEIGRRDSNEHFAAARWTSRSP